MPLALFVTYVRTLMKINLDLRYKWKATSLIALGHIAGSAGSSYGTKFGY